MFAAVSRNDVKPRGGTANEWLIQTSAEVPQQAATSSKAQDAKRRIAVRAKLWRNIDKAREIGILSTSSKKCAKERTSSEHCQR